MILPMPDWNMAKLAVEGYAEDGVRGEVGYDEKTGQWYAELNDEDYDQYMNNLRQRGSEVLSDFRDLFKDGAVNVQGAALVPPRDNENRLALYLVDSTCQTVRGFKVNAAVTDVFQRKSAHMFYGSTCGDCGKKVVAVLTWEDVRPKGGEK